MLKDNSLSWKKVHVFIYYKRSPIPQKSLVQIETHEHLKKYRSILFSHEL